MPQLGLLYMLIAMPMNILSGSNTPLESMPHWLATIMQASPLEACVIWRAPQRSLTQISERVSSKIASALQSQSRPEHASAHLGNPRGGYGEGAAAF